MRRSADCVCRWDEGDCAVFLDEGDEVEEDTLAVLEFATGAEHDAALGSGDDFFGGRATGGRAAPRAGEEGELEEGGGGGFFLRVSGGGLGSREG